MQWSNNEVVQNSTSAAGVLTSLDCFPSPSTFVGFFLRRLPSSQLALGLIAHGFINPCKRDSRWPGRLKC